jgi:TonB family protein
MSTTQVNWSYRRDDSRRQTESVVKTAEGVVVRRLLYSEDEAGNLSNAAQYDDNGKLAQKWIYDSTGDVKELNVFDAGGSLIERAYYSYEYDSQKNWIKRVASRQMKGDTRVPFEVSYRTLVYYSPIGEFQMNGGVIPGGVPKNAASQTIVLSGQATKRVEPVYSTTARAAHISGTVTVEVTVDEEGDVLSARAITGHPLLREAALDAAWDWKFSPVIYRGRPVKIIGAIQFNFQS